MLVFVLFHLQAQRFLALVLLPKVRQDIEDNKRCHFALFQAMKKATYKPDAFFKVTPPPQPACIAFQCTLAASLNLSMFIYVRLAATGAAVGVNVDAVGVSQDAVGVVWDVAKDSQSGIAFI